MADFITSFNRMMRWEGWEIENVPGDAGGLTCCGITKINNPDWPGWGVLERNGNTIDEEIKMHVKMFYQIKYRHINLDRIDLQSPSDQIFQAYINCGTIALQWAQLVVGTVPDRIIGRMTIDAINHFGAELFCNNFCDKQITYYKAIVNNNPSQEKFLKGWLARAEDFRAA